MGATSVRRLLPLVTLAWLTAARPAAADEWIIEVGPEAADAGAAGAADVKRAQALAKQKKYADAVDLFEAVARKAPAALHDCYLALAYLRAGALTRAQLLWDVARLRNSDRPGWCTGELGQQLATALRAARFVPLTITVVPADAVVRVGGVAMRGLSVIWLPAGPQRITAAAPGMADADVDVEIKAPSASVTLTLASPAAPPPVPPPVGPPAVTQPGGPGISEPIPIEPPVVLPSGPPDAPDRADGADKADKAGRGRTGADVRDTRGGRRTRWPGWVAAGIGGAALVAGGVFHVRAVDARDEADQLYRFQPEFVAADERFGRERNRALIGYGLGTIAVGIGVWWLLSTVGGDR